MTSIGGRIVLELLAFGGMTELSLIPVPRETKSDVTLIGERIVLELIAFGGMIELGLTPVPMETEGDVTSIVGRIVLELTSGPRGMEPEGIAGVTKGTEWLLDGKTATPLLVLGNGGRTELEERGIVVP